MIISYVSNDGELLGFVYSSNIDEDADSDSLYPGAKKIIGSPPASKAYWSFKDKTWVSINPPPNDFYSFNYSTKQWVDSRTQESEWAAVRSKRNTLLTQSDWTQMPDVSLTTKELWATYRQDLRDITDQTDPFNIVWPTPPN